MYKKYKIKIFKILCLCKIFGLIKKNKLAHTRICLKKINIINLEWNNTIKIKFKFIIINNFIDKLTFQFMMGLKIK